jgi:nucleoside-diphosphate-sugar epimerase
MIGAMRVVVLGGTGFVGPHVVRELAELGHEVTIFHSGANEGDLPASVRHVHGRFEEFERHAPELRELEPDVVLDMVPFTRSDVSRVRAFRGVADRAVLVSSGDVYRAFGRGHGTELGPPDPTPLTEDSPLREVVIDPEYDKVGVEAEASVIADLPAALLRLPAVHGPGDAQHRLHRYLRPMAEGRPSIEIDEALQEWRWMRGYVEDVGHAVALAVAAPASSGRAYNVAYERHFTEPEWIRELGRVYGWAGEVVPRSRADLPPELGIDFDTAQDFVVDSSRIRRELGYAEVVDFDEALRRTIEWELAHPPELDVRAA